MDIAAGTGGFVINGQAANDQSGFSVASAGDVNGDGLADLIVGASLSDPAAGTDAGRSYVVFGQSSGRAIELSTIAGGTGGFVINGQASGDKSGVSVASAGDFNGDARSDLVLQNDSGALAFWLMNGTTLSLGRESYLLPSTWRLTGAGNFAEPQRNYLVFQNLADGSVAFWKMDGTTVIEGTLPYVISTDWKIAAP